MAIQQADVLMQLTTGKSIFSEEYDWNRTGEQQQYTTICLVLSHLKKKKMSLLHPVGGKYEK